MKVVLKAICDDAFVSENGKLNIIGIFDHIRAERFPTIHPKMAFVFVLEGEEGEEGKRFSYYIDVAGSSGAKVFEGSNQKREVALGLNGRINLVMGFQLLNFPGEGIYTATAHFGDLTETLVFSVKNPNK